jgi:signal transduction histidine kinase
MHDTKITKAILKISYLKFMFRFRVSPPMQLALIFLLFGTLWIILTDVLTVSLAKNNLGFITKIQIYKGVLFMVISAILIFIVSKKILLKQYQLQEQLNKERLLYKNELAIEVFNAQEYERQKIGEELHDNVNQMLGVVKLYVEHAQMNPPAREEMLRRSSEYLKETIDEIRKLSGALVSPPLDDIGLVASISELSHAIVKIRKMEITVRTAAFEESKLSVNQKLMLYRITQEQLNNILKHSQAAHVSISLQQCDDMVTLKIEDDGVGFDPSGATRGLGLKNMRHRLELFNGRMNIDSSPQEGCRLQASFNIIRA